MKKSIQLMLFVIIGLLFVNSNTYAQDNTGWGNKIKLQLHKFLNLNSDGECDRDEIIKVRKRNKFQDGSGECTGFVDEDEDGVCDNCGGTGDCDRDRLKDGKGLKRRGGN